MTAVGMKIKDQAESYSGCRIEDTDRIWSRLDKELREKEGSKMAMGPGWGHGSSGARGWGLGWVSSELDLVSQRWRVSGGGGGWV